MKRMPAGRGRALSLIAGVGLLGATLVSAGPSGAAGTTPNKGLQAARAAVAKAEATPTKIGVTTPLRKKAPTGKTIAYLQCDVDTCVNQRQGMEAATKAIGWTLKVIPFALANPATLITAMNQALQYNPVAVYFTSLPYATWSSEVPVYAKAGVALIPGFIGPGPIDQTVIANIEGPTPVTQPGTAEAGSWLADWIISNSDGHADTLFQSIPGLEVLAAYQSGFTSTYKKNCPTCKLTIVDFTTAQATASAMNSVTESRLQTNPGIHYVVADNGSFVDGLPSVLKTAGLTDVKIVGESPGPEQSEGVKTGNPQFGPWVGQAQIYSGWLAVDIALRHLEGMSFAPSD